MNVSTPLRRLTSVVVACTFLLAGLSSLDQPAEAVVGGEPTSIKNSPWQAMIFVESDNRLCGASIVDESWMVTAAHCVVGLPAGQVTAHVGITRLDERSTSNAVDIAEVIVHPSWDATRFRNDIALLRLARPLEQSPTVRAISLPVGIDASQWPPAGTPARIIGWGATGYDEPASNVLRVGDLQVLGGPGDPECGRYGGDFDVAVEICAGTPDATVDACQGDSGSPLIVDVSGSPVLAGLTSVGFECARVGYPGIYTRIGTFLSWIQEYIPAAISAPSGPQQVEVAAIAGERLRVDWQPPLQTPSGPVVQYRAVAEPSDRACLVGPTELACVIENVPAGKLYSVTVTALAANGESIAADPVQAVSVDGVTSLGVLVKPNRLASWAGLELRGRDDVRLAVRPGSADVCSREGKRANPRGVRSKGTGLCAVRVTVVKPNGNRNRSIAYLEVR